MPDVQILVVEDENIVAKDIQNRLKNMGYGVPAVSATGEDALERVAQLRPDLVLMDIMLKGAMDGVTAAERIRSQFGLPVVYLTAYSDENTLARAKISEPFGYLLKPFEERELYTTIEMALYKHKMERKLKENEQWLATTLKSIGDAVIATDKNGRIAFMNPVAENLTGWRQIDALGRDLEEVFNVIDERTRTHIESPSLRVLKGKSAIRLSYNVQLIARDGVETPIDDSASPILDAKGNILGVVVTFRDITERRVAEEVLRQHAQYLVKRVKELHCLYAIFRIVEKPALSLEEILRQTINSIPPAWQYPELTAVRIVAEGKEYATSNFTETTWIQAADIFAFGGRIGTVQVCYLQKKPDVDEGPFLKEERSLINAIAVQLGFIVERKSTETGLRKRIAELERYSAELEHMMTTALHESHESRDSKDRG
jgi:PAS domain S-box-containing protein